jgi:hypothetical protein
VSADTIVPGAGNPQAFNRYSYVLNSPLNYQDPTGHYACGDGENEECDGTGTDGSTTMEELYEALGLGLPSDVPSVNGTLQETLERYEEFRRTLFMQFGLRYISYSGANRGKIADRVILSVLIATEFGSLGRGSVVFGEALEALSRQFFSEAGSTQTPCRGGCTFEAQLIWLQTKQGFRDKPLNNWAGYFDYAKDVMRSDFRYGVERASWEWGNVDTNSQMWTWIRSGERQGEAYVVADRQQSFVVLTVGQNNAMRGNCWHANPAGPYFRTCH